MPTPILNYLPVAMPGNVPGRLAVHPSRFLLIGTILFAGLVSIPQLISFGAVSGLGAGSAVICALALLFWIRRPHFSQVHIAVLLPLLMFGIYHSGSLLWFTPTTKGLQLLCVLMGFVALVLLSAREVENDPGFATILHKTADIATVFAVGVYALSVPIGGMETEVFMLPRPFALFVLLGVARQVAVWQRGNWLGLVRAGLILFVVYLSVSRTAMASALLMIPLAALIRGDRKGVMFAITTAVVGVSAIAIGIAVSPKMQERFFGLDASMKVGGVAVNASGRTEMWAMLWEDAFKSPILGQGVGSSALLIDDHFPGLGHPHNDFLRFFYDFGIIGLSFWMIFHGAAIVTTFLRARRAARANSPDLPVHLVPMLLLIAIGPAMLTDNPVSYLFVMSPLAIMLGSSLGLHAARLNEREERGRSSGGSQPPTVKKLSLRRAVPPPSTPTLPRLSRLTRTAR